MNHFKVTENGKINLNNTLYDCKILINMQTHLANKYSQNWMSKEGISLEVVNLSATCGTTDNFHVFSSYESTPLS